MHSKEALNKSIPFVEPVRFPKQPFVKHSKSEVIFYDYCGRLGIHHPWKAVWRSKAG